MSDPRRVDGGPPAGTRLGRRPPPAGRRPAPVGLRPRLPARRRDLRDAPRPRRPRRPSSTSTSPGCAARRPGSTSRCPPDIDGPAGRRHRGAARRRRARRSGRRRLDPDHGLARAVPRSRAAAARRGRRADHRDPGLAGRPAAGRSSRARPPPRRVGRPARPGRTRWSTLKTTSRADYVFARLEARRAGADDALFLTVDDHLSEGTTANIFLVRRATGDGRPELATPSLDCAILPGTTRSWLLGWASARRAPAGRGLASRRPTSRPRTRRSCARAWPGSCRSRASPASPIGDGEPGPWTRRARADREAMIQAGDGPA